MDEKAWIRIQKYCAWQERCHSEVRQKLVSLGVRGLELEEMIVKLIEQNFLNEERFSKAFAGGKFRVKKWGRNKIRQELKQRQISDYCIQSGLNEIDEETYLQTLTELLFRKSRDYKNKSDFELNGNLAAFCIRKGWEPDLVWESIKTGDWKKKT